MTAIFFLVSLLTSVAGAICGIGGGVIIKPVLDATGLLSVSAISFLSGCTVLAMTAVSVGRNLSVKTVRLNYRIATALAAGSAAGGAIGKYLFHLLRNSVGRENIVGLVQAALLAILTAGALLYTLYKKKIATKSFHQIWLCVLLGIALGLLSSFLGIGGGPVNLVVLAYFFSMGTKEAALCSQYIILFSQLAGLCQTLVTGSVPAFRASDLAVMIAGGVLGGFSGSLICKRIRAKSIDRLFDVLMIVIILINLFNIGKFCTGLF